MISIPKVQPDPNFLSLPFDFRQKYRPIHGFSLHFMQALPCNYKKFCAIVSFENQYVVLLYFNAGQRAAVRWQTFHSQRTSVFFVRKKVTEGVTGFSRPERPCIPPLPRSAAL
jgi:hypothetical protein